MSNEVYILDPVEQVEYVDKPGKRIVKGQFKKVGSDLEGLIYHIPEYTDYAVFTREVDPEAILDSYNRDAAARLVARARNKYLRELPAEPAQVSIYKERFKMNPIIVSVQEADEYRPGQREASSTALTKRLNKVLSEFTATALSGDTNKTLALQQEMTAIMQRLQEMVQEKQQLMEAAAA